MPFLMGAVLLHLRHPVPSNIPPQRLLSDTLEVAVVFDVTDARREEEAVVKVIYFVAETKPVPGREPVRPETAQRIAKSLRENNRNDLERLSVELLEGHAEVHPAIYLG